MKKLSVNLTFQVIVAIVLGVLAGLLFPGFAPAARLISQTFINMINMLIAPIIFVTLILGIARMSDMKKLGRVGGKALLYFEIITTFSLATGLIVANLIRPGEGVDPSAISPAGAASGTRPLTFATTGTTAPFDWMDFIAHIIPHNIFDSFAKGDILQILFFAILFGIALSRMGNFGQPLITTFERLSKVLFNMMEYIMRLAPIGAFGGMAFTVGNFGLKILGPMSKAVLAVYLTCGLFVFVVLGLIAYYNKFSILKYLRFIREEILIVYGTSSSESVLPSMMQKMEQLGCSRSVVGLVIPTGYSFNLDGTSIYLSIALVFLTQVFHLHMSLTQQLTALGILIVTSKGAAGVTGSGFIVLSSTLAVLKIMPVENVAVLLGIDRFMSEARSITNLIGNGVATIVISKSEKEFDESAYRRATET
ncbi:MAG TPA: C4-dicarboxylate transporter DctA [Puia sp.]|jgi:aerobic C4-dicarboxylate transport protein